MNQGHAIRDPEGKLTCFTETAENSIKWHVAGYEAFRDGRAVDVSRINKGWWPQLEQGWSCVEAVLLEASEHEAMAMAAETYAQKWEDRLEAATTGAAVPGAADLTQEEKDGEAVEGRETETITTDQVGSLEGELVDAEFDPAEDEEDADQEEAAAEKEAEQEIENR